MSTLGTTFGLIRQKIIIIPNLFWLQLGIFFFTIFSQFNTLWRHIHTHIALSLWKIAVFYIRIPWWVSCLLETRRLLLLSWLIYGLRRLMRGTRSSILMMIIIYFYSTKYFLQIETQRAENVLYFFYSRLHFTV